MGVRGRDQGNSVQSPNGRPLNRSLCEYGGTDPGIDAEHFEGVSHPEEYFELAVSHDGGDISIVLSAGQQIPRFGWPMCKASMLANGAGVLPQRNSVRKPPQTTMRLRA